MYKIIDFFVRFGIILLFGYGLWLLLGTCISDTIRNKARKKVLMKKAHKSKAMTNKLINYLAHTLSVVQKKGMDTTRGVFLFLLYSILLFAFSLAYTLQFEGVLKSVIISLFIGMIPFLILQARLRTAQIKGSYEGTGLVTTVINNYKQYNFNMIEAIDKTSCANQLSFFSRNNLLRLSLALKEYRTEDELDEAVRTFVFAYNTEWAILLGMNIKIAAFDGTNVAISLEDILEELKSTGETLEANKRFNNEAFTMIRFLLIPLYLFTVLISINGFGFTLKKFIQYQFFTSIGLSFAVLTFSSILLSFLVYSFMKRPKFDL